MVKNICSTWMAIVAILLIPTLVACGGSGGNSITGVSSQCEDGIDNDNDGMTDLNDPGCGSPEDNSEAPDPDPDPGVPTDPNLRDGSLTPSSGSIVTFNAFGSCAASVTFTCDNPKGKDWFFVFSYVDATGNDIATTTGGLNQLCPARSTTVITQEVCATVDGAISEGLEIVAHWNHGGFKPVKVGGGNLTFLVEGHTFHWQKE